MGVLERSATQKIIISSMVATLFVATLLFAGLMVWHSSHLRGQITTARSEEVSIGPIALAKLTKTPLKSGGYDASIQLLAGLWLYVIEWLSVACGVAYIRVAFATLVPPADT